MKLTTILLLAATLQASAGAYAQAITYSGKNVSLNAVFSSIENQTGFVFFYRTDDLKNAPDVTVSFKEVMLEDALKQLLSGQPFSYTIQGKTIFISKIVNRPSSGDQSRPRTGPISGKVMTEDDTPLAGATVAVRGRNNNTVSTNAEGIFFLNADEGDIVSVSFVGYEPRTLTVTASTINTGNLVFVLRPSVIGLDAAQVTVSTGYQQVKVNQVTGAFSKLVERQLNEQVSSSILNKMEGQVPGVLFNRSSTALTTITIRGDASINGSSPLIVLDNFPYAGDINNINPNNIESITFLKDAAAASIWGARAGNGVIVITTKSGRYGQKMTIGVNSNYSFNSKPDLSYIPNMSIPDYIEWETYLFDKGMYASMENSSFYPALSPVVELLIAKRDGTLSAAEATRQINLLKARPDNRSDQLKYLYQNAFSHRHAINISGGTNNANYYFSAAYDKNNAQVKANSDQRISLNLKNSYLLFRGLTLSSEILFTQSANHTGTIFTSSGFPYEAWVDENGNALPVTSDYRSSFKQQGENDGLLNWQRRPADEIGKAANNFRQSDYLINVGLKYNLVKNLTAELKYQFEKQQGEQNNRQDTNLYAIRNLINLYTQTNPDGSVAYRPVPPSGILDISNSSLVSHSGRFQLSYRRVLKGKHDIIFLTGAEIRDIHTTGSNSRQYGYSDQGLTTAPIDYLTYYQLYNMFAWQSIPYQNGLTDGTERSVSYFANIGYNFKNRFSFTASGRKDAANLFGIKTNQRWQPLWSVGGAWNINSESFYRVGWLPLLRFRSTYGINGITATGIAYTTATYQRDNLTGLNYALIGNPPNPGARWEKVKIANWAIEFATAKNIVSGTIEYYRKQGVDLVGNSPLDPTTGYYVGADFSVRRNYAKTKGDGIDITLATQNLNRGLTWNTTLLLSYNNIKVSKFYGVPTVYGYLNGVPVQGVSIGELYSYAWMGLNTMGHPQGQLDHQVSTNYDDIISRTTTDELIKSGNSIPQYFGSFKNSFGWKGVSLTISLLYKLNYYFRRSSFGYGIGSNHKDYALRWQRPGDEQYMQIPAIPADISNASNEISFYSNSEALIEKGDHIRLQYVHLAYNFTSQLAQRLGLRECQLYFNASNLGIIWRANNKGIDPDYQIGVPVTKTFSMGIQARL